MSRIAIEQLSSHITKQEESAVMRELNSEEIATILGGRGNNEGGSNNDVDGGNTVDVGVDVLPIDILSGNNILSGINVSFSGGAAGILSGLLGSLGL